MNRLPREGEAVSPYELQCVGIGGCYESIPPGTSGEPGAFWISAEALAEHHEREAQA